MPETPYLDAWIEGHREKTAARRMDKFMREAIQQVESLPMEEQMRAAKELMGRWRRPKGLEPKWNWRTPEESLLIHHRAPSGLDIRNEMMAAIAAGREPASLRRATSPTTGFGGTTFTSPYRSSGMDRTPKRPGWDLYAKREARVPAAVIPDVEVPPFIPLEYPA